MWHGTLRLDGIQRLKQQTEMINQTSKIIINTNTNLLFCQRFYPKRFMTPRERGDKLPCLRAQCISSCVTVEGFPASNLLRRALCNCIKYYFNDTFCNGRKRYVMTKFCNELSLNYYINVYKYCAYIIYKMFIYI